MKARLEVDPYDYRVADLYIPKSGWDILVNALGTNKLTVVLRIEEREK